MNRQPLRFVVLADVTDRKVRIEVGDSITTTVMILNLSAAKELAVELARAINAIETGIASIATTSSDTPKDPP